MEITLFSCENNAIHIRSDRKPTGVDCANHVVLLSDDPSRLQACRYLLNDNADFLGAHFSPLKCKVLFLDWTGSKLNRALSGAQLGHMKRFRCLRSFNAPGALTWETKVSVGL